MKKSVLAMAMVAVMMANVPLAAYAAETIERTSPAKETTINGIPESEYGIRQTRDVIARTFYDYENNVHTPVKYYQKIATFTHDNTLGNAKATMVATVTRSTSKGSDWTFSGGFGTEFKAKILAKADVGFSLKQTRSTNEAVGYSVTNQVSVGKVGNVELYYQGEKIGGVATYKQFNTANPSNYIYVTEDVNATVYDAESLAINSKYYETNS